MAKKVKTILKLNLAGGQANPAPPIGPTLGQHGVAIMEFCNQYNAATKDKKGQMIPAVVTIYEDRTFSFELRLAPVAAMIKKELNLKKGSSMAGRETVASLSQSQIKKIAQEKMADLNTDSLEQAIKIVAGSARSMGIKTEGI